MEQIQELSHIGLIEFLICLLYTSDAADEEDSVDLGGRRIIKKNQTDKNKNSIIPVSYTHLRAHET